MTSSGLFPNVELMLGMALAGFVFGLAYFAALRRTVALIAAGSGWRSPTALTLGRIAAATLLFAVAAIKLGAAPLLAVSIGFLLARAAALRAARRAA